MNSFSAVKAATEGFRLFFGKPGLTIVLIVLSIASGFGISAMMVATVGPQLSEMAAARTSGEPPDPQAALSSLGAIMQFGLLAGLIGLALAAVTASAVYRAQLRPKDSRFPFIGFMGDELRAIVVNIVLFFIVGIPCFIVYFLVTVVGSIAVMASMGSGGMEAMAAGGGAPPLGIMIAAFGGMGLAAIVGILWFAKFCLALPQTVAERGLRIFGSWELTNGHYWKVVGTLLLTIIICVVIGLVSWGIELGVAVATGGGLKDLMQPDMSTMGALFTPLTLTRTVVSGVLGTLMSMTLLGAAGVMYRGLAEGTEGAAAVFAEDDEDWDDE